MAYIHNALPYKQKQVLPLMLPSTTHPTTITRFQVSLDTSQNAFKFRSTVLLNLGHLSSATDVPFSAKRKSQNDFLAS